MASAILRFIVMNISKGVEAIFDKVEYSLAERALRHAGKLELRRAVSGKTHIEGMERVMEP